MDIKPATISLWVKRLKENHRFSTGLFVLTVVLTVELLGYPMTGAIPIWATYPYSSIFHPVEWNCSLTEMNRRAMFRPIFAVKSSNRSNHIKGLVRKFILSMCAVFVSYMESIL